MSPRLLACLAIVSLASTAGCSGTPHVFRPPRDAGSPDGDAGGATGQIGSMCDRGNQPLWAKECPGGANAICEPFDLCGIQGFCAQSCDSAPCPAGSVCTTLTSLDPVTLKPSTRKRCFLPCNPSAGSGGPGGTGSEGGVAEAGTREAGQDGSKAADGGTSESGTADAGNADAGGPASGGCPGQLECIFGYDVCGSPALFSEFGSTGGHAPSGAACVSGTPPDPGAAPRLFSANVAVAPPGSSEAAVAVGPDGTFYVGYNLNGLSVSTDHGATWTAAPIDDPNNLGDPAIAVDPSTNRVYFSHLSQVGAMSCTAGEEAPTGMGVNVSFSDDHGKTWSHTSTVTPAADSTGGLAVDKDWIAVLPDGTVLVSYMVGGNAITATTSHAMVARSTDHGLTFTSVELDPTRPAFRNLIQLATDSTGVAYASFWESPPSANAPLGGVRLAKSYDDGRTWTPSVAATPGGAAIFDVPGLAVSPRGSPIAVTWAQAPASPPGPDVEDVYATVSLDEGATFLPPVMINHDTPVVSGTPQTCATHWHPFPAIDSWGNVYVLWYDNRWGDGRVLWAKGTVNASARSLTFGASDLGFVTDKTQPFTTSRDQFFVGDYLGFAISGTTALAAWGDLRDASSMAEARIYSATATLP